MAVSSPAGDGAKVCSKALYKLGMDGAGAGASNGPCDVAKAGFSSRGNHPLGAYNTTSRLPICWSPTRVLRHNFPTRTNLCL